MEVPFADLYGQYLGLKDEIDTAIADVIAESAFIRGPRVVQFEEDFARAIGTERCVSCANGTDAIYIAMVALGMKPGDEVIVPAMSWISTSETVSQAGGRPVFCDIDATTYTIDPQQIEGLITDRTVGIIPVHLYGQPADMAPIMEIATRRGLWVIEDCAQSHLAQYRGQTVGTFGVASTFSFYPGKNLGAMGDAGAIVTNDTALADRMAMFARHGGLVKGDHQIEGINSRMDGLQAAVLSIKLARLSDWTQARQEMARAYDAKLAGFDVLTLPKVEQDRDSVWHLYVVQTPKRDALAQHLKSHGIATSVNYPRALPFLPCYAPMEPAETAFPQARQLADCGLALPMFAEMTEAQQDKVVAAIAAFR